MVKDIFFDLQRFGESDTTGASDGGASDNGSNSSGSGDDVVAVTSAPATTTANGTTVPDETDSNGTDQIINPDDDPDRDDHADILSGTRGDYDVDGVIDDAEFEWNRLNPNTGEKLHHFRSDRITNFYNEYDNGGYYSDIITSAGTINNPAHLVPASVRGSVAMVSNWDEPSIYLDGTQYDYAFATDTDLLNWNVSLQGAENVFRGDLDLNDNFASYGLSGTATVGIYQTKEFSEILNGQDQTFIKYAVNYKDSSVTGGIDVAKDNYDSQIDVEIKASDGFDSTAFTYTIYGMSGLGISGVDSVKVGLDSNDTLVFVNSTDTTKRIYTADYDSDADGNIIAATVSIAAENVSIGTAVNDDEHATIGTFDFYNGNATLTNDNLDVNVAVKEGTRVRVTDNRLTTTDERYYDDWKFDTKSTRDVVSLTSAHADYKTDPSNDVTGYNASDIVKVVNYTDKATLISTDGLDNTVTLKPDAKSADTYVWQQITGDLRVIQFDGKGNATINNTDNGEVKNFNGNEKLGDVIVRGQAGLEAQFDTITADGVVVNGHKNGTEGATITAATLQTFAADDDDLLKLSTDTTNLANPQSSKSVTNPVVSASNYNDRGIKEIPEDVTYPLTSANPINVSINGNNGEYDDISVELGEGGEDGIKSITVNKDDEDAPIKVAGDKQFDVIAGRKTFGVTTTANDVTFAVRDVVLLSPDDVYDREDLRTKNYVDNPLMDANDSVEVSQDWTDLGALDPRRGITNVTDKNYSVGIRDKDYAIKDALVVRVNPNEENQGYSVTGGDAVFDIEDITKGADATFTINGAAVNLTNGNTVDNDNYIVTASSLKSGVDTITGLEANDAVSVSGDADGYVAIFQPVNGKEPNDVVTFSVNGANFSVKAKFVDDNAVTVIADSGNNVTIQGIENYEYGTTADSNKETPQDNEEKSTSRLEKAIVTVAGGAVYHFKNDRDRNMVTVSSGGTAEVTLNADGDISTNETVVDVIDEDDAKRIYADRSKWNEIATVGSSTVNSDLQDTVTVHHAQVYEDFYNIGNSNVSSNTVAGYADQDAEAGEGVSNINIAGANVKGEAAAIGEATHVTLTGDSSIGKVPINIQQNESSVVKDVKIELANSDSPSTVSIGTRDTVTASHNVQLSNSSTETNPSYAYLGKLATGENVIQAGGAAMIRHDGTSRATLLGGTGVDTIMGNVNDIVQGGAGGDFFYDISGYAADYNVTEGDVIIASRLRDINEVNLTNLRGSGNQIGFGNGENLLTLGNIDPNGTVHVKVAVMDDDGNVKYGVRDLVLANGNVLVDATPADTNGALIVSNITRGDGVHSVIGSAGADTIFVGSNDFVYGAEGNDSIAIDANSFGVEVAISAGLDTVSGWNFGFDRAKGATKLNAGGAEVRGRMYEDKLLISLEGADAEISFEDTRVLGVNNGMHGQYNVLVDDKKFVAIRNGDSGEGYAVIDSNDDIADYYLAEREGRLYFTNNVTEYLGEINLGSDKYVAIRELHLANNSKAVVLGSADRETVALYDTLLGGGAAALGANKVVSLGGGNDVIQSGFDGLGIAGNTFMFGAGDGRDTIYGFEHYLGVNYDPDKQMCDTIVLQSYNGVKAEVDVDGTTRVEFALGGAPTENEYVCVYEGAGAFDYDNKMYKVQITDVGVEGMAKIGYSTTDNPTNSANLFTYDREVSFYIGSSGEAIDTLKVKNISENVEIRMDKPGTFNEDGSYNTFYRGIGVVDASEETNTNISIAGSAADNMLIAGNDGTRNFLWGGAGDNTLIGGTGNDYFLYYKNSNYYTAGADPNAEGNHDEVVNYNENQDFIVLADVTIGDINYAAMAQAGGNYGITENSVTVCFNNGGSLTVDITNQETVQFYMGDGSIYEARRDTGAWNKVK